MAKAHDSWNVLAHDPIEQLAENLWRVEGSLPGMSLRRVMTVARMADGRLVIHNGVALNDAAMAQLEASGAPAFLVVPNGYHRLDAAAYKARYPALTVLCPFGARARVEQVVPTDGVLADFPGDPSVALRDLDGVGGAEGVMVVRSAGGATLVFTDIVFNMPHGAGVTGFIFRYLTASTGGPRVSRVARWMVVKDRAAVRADLEKLAETPVLCRVIVSHHKMITEDPAGTLKRVAATL